MLATFGPVCGNSVVSTQCLQQSAQRLWSEPQRRSGIIIHSMRYPVAKNYRRNLLNAVNVVICSRKRIPGSCSKIHYRFQIRVMRTRFWLFRHDLIKYSQVEPTACLLVFSSVHQFQTSFQSTFDFTKVVGRFRQHCCPVCALVLIMFVNDVRKQFRRHSHFLAFSLYYFGNY